MTRILSAALLGAIVVYIIAAAPLLLGAAVVFAATLIAAHEMAGLSEAAGCPFPRVTAIAAAFTMAGGAWAGGPGGLAAGLTAGFALLFMGMVLTGDVEGAVIRLSGGTFLLLYPVWSLLHLVFFLDSVPGRRALLFLLGCVWVCDSAAYYVGSAVGKRKLAPAISPNKTIAGAVGGTVGACAAAVLLKIANLVPWPLMYVVGAGLVIAVLGQMGDLAESMIKRDAGVKDSGSLIPGHGGMMDRVDALLFTVPVFYYMLLISGGLA